jgi:hypothetical protein
MLKYIINYLFPKQPFEIQKPRKYITFDEYDELSDRAKILLHSKYDVYLIPELYIEEED